MFDYIIVGAGSAGCVLAHRLTEDPNVTVLLLEAGGPDTQREVHIPVAFPLLFKSDCDWAYETEEQCALNHRKLFWPRGKMLGGTSSMNGMIYIRGNRHDYDQWCALGNPGWAFDDVLAYFKKGEHQARGKSAYHGVDGPLHVADLRHVNRLTSIFMKAALMCGFGSNPDFNGASQEGVGLYQVNQKRGRRHSAAAAYLKPVLHRRNLTVYTHAHVTRLIFQSKRATGLECWYQGNRIQFSAAREIILCGGAINSPQLLMLSGIGPADHLRAVEIPVVADLPGVGQNLQDHLQISVIHDCTKPFSIASTESTMNLMQFLLLRKGPYTSNIGEAGLFVKTSPQLPVPDLQLFFAPNYSMCHGFDNPPGDGFTIGICPLHPQSRGRLTLRSNDPLAPPAIQPNYLTSADDLSTLLAGIRIAREIIKCSPFDSVRGPEVWPSSEAQSEEALAEFIRKRAESLYHPVGTCKMGNDPLSVVDESLRVHGVEGLRVVDASIMPTLISGNTNAPTIMIAEKGTDMIKQSTSPKQIVEGSLQH